MDSKKCTINVICKWFYCISKQILGMRKKFISHSFVSIKFLIYHIPINQNGQMIVEFTQWSKRWNDFIKAHIESLKEYHDIVLDYRSKQCSRYFIIYEDLLTNPQYALKKVFCFFLNLEFIESINIKRRIKEVIALRHKATITYDQNT